MFFTPFTAWKRACNIPPSKTRNTLEAKKMKEKSWLESVNFCLSTRLHERKSELFCRLWTHFVSWHSAQSISCVTMNQLLILMGFHILTHMILCPRFQNDNHDLGRGVSPFPNSIKLSLWSKTAAKNQHNGNMHVEFSIKEEIWISKNSLLSQIKSSSVKHMGFFCTFFLDKNENTMCSDGCPVDIG